MTTHRQARDRFLRELDAADPNWDIVYDNEYDAAEALGLSHLLREVEYSDDAEPEELNFDDDSRAGDLRWWEEQNADADVDPDA